VDANARPIPIKNDPSMFESRETVRYDAAPRGIYALWDCVVDPLSGLTRAADGRIITEVVGSPPLRNRRIGVAVANSLAGWRNRARRSLLRAGVDTYIEGPAAVLAPSYYNYYHWSIECLTRVCELSVYMDAHPAEDVQIIVPPELPGWAHESLEMLGVADRCVQMDEPIRVDRLLVPSFGDPTRLECEWLRDQVTAPKEAHRRIFIARTDATRRRVGNMDELQRVFNRWDIEVVVLSELSVREQIDLFSEAELVIGVTGAGLANLIYSFDADCLVIFGDLKGNTYPRLCEILSIPYDVIFCDQRGINILIDPSILEKKLENWKIGNW